MSLPEILSIRTRSGRAGPGKAARRPSRPVWDRSRRLSPTWFLTSHYKTPAASARLPGLFRPGGRPDGWIFGNGVL